MNRRHRIRKLSKTQTRSSTNADIDQTSSNVDDETYANMEGGERGTNRSPRNIQMNRVGRKIKPEETAHDGVVSSQFPSVPFRESLPILLRREVHARSGCRAPG